MLSSLTQLAHPLTIFGGSHSKARAKSSVSRVPVAEAPTSRPFRVVSRVRESSRSVQIMVPMLIVLNAVLLVSYFFAVNHYSAKGFEVKQYTLGVQKLESENKKMQVQFAEAGVIGNVQEELLANGFVPVTSVEFIGTKKFSER